MNLPMKINLYLATTLPGYFIGEQVKTNTVGGNPTEVINRIQNRIYNFLLTKDNSSVKLNFEFDNTQNLLEDNTKSKYLDLNKNGAFFALKYLKVPESPIDLPSKNLILRCFDNMSNEQLDNFIKKWKEDKRNFNDRIINIFLFGKIFNGDVLVSNYILTRKYHGYKDILQLDENLSIIYISRLVEFLDELNKLNMVYRDLEFSNIGYDRLPSGEIKFVVLNYTDDTLLNLNDKFFDTFKLTGCNSKYCGGTLIPYYVVKDYFYSNPDWLKRLDKLYSLGLAEIIICMFFKDNETFHELYNLLSGIASLNSSLYYHHLISIFDDNANYDKIINLINDLDYRFPNSNPLIEKMFKQIVVNLFSKDYDKIYYPKDIIVLINKILPSNAEFNAKPISTIHPIGSYPDNKSNPVQIQNEINKLTKKNIRLEDLKKIVMVGGDNLLIGDIKYKNLYLKYKSKYINLKNSKK